MDLNAVKNDMGKYVVAFGKITPKMELVTAEEFNEAFETDCFDLDVYVSPVTKKLEELVKTDANVYWLDDYVYGTLMEADEMEV